MRMRPDWTLRVFPFALVALSACPDRPLVEESQEDAVQAFAEARCSGLQRCECVSDSQFDDCVSATRTLVEDIAGTYVGPVDLSCIRSAAENWSDTPCVVEPGAPADPDLAACQLADFNGVGEPCMLQDEFLFFTPHHCAPGLYCDGEACAMAQVVAEGGDCNDTSECISGLRCISARCTAEQAAVGEPCVSHEHCVFATAFCDDGLCVPVLGQLEACEENAACSLPFFCLDGVCDFPTGKTCSPWED